MHFATNFDTHLILFERRETAARNLLPARSKTDGSPGIELRASDIWILRWPTVESVNDPDSSIASEAKTTRNFRTSPKSQKPASRFVTRLRDPSERILDTETSICLETSSPTRCIFSILARVSPRRNDGAAALDAWMRDVENRVRVARTDTCDWRMRDGGVPPREESIGNSELEQRHKRNYGRETIAMFSSALAGAAARSCGRPRTEYRPWKSRLESSSDY